MSWRMALVCLLFGCCAGLARLGLMYLFRSFALVALIGLVVAALCLFGVARSRGGGRLQPFTLLTAFAATLAGWLVMPSLVCLLLLAPFPQRWALIGSWETVAEANGPMLVRREFSPWGTSKIYRNGELRVTGRYVFLDDRTIEVESHNVPGRITEGPQYTKYRLQLEDDELTMTSILVDRVSVYRREGQ
jgi:hypothetical protein